MEKLNIYGDYSNDELNGYGVDISLQRTDTLDLTMLEAVKSSKVKKLRVLDLGCGRGGQSIRLAEIGCNVVAIDIQNFYKEIENNCKENKVEKSKISFIKCDIRHTNEYLIGAFDFMYSQRTFHYIDYKDCEKLLKSLRQHLTQNYSARLFISVSGIQSELGEDYEDKKKPIKYRFCQLSKKNRQKHKILLPVCLYSLDEFQELLIKCKYSIDKIYQSDFGNIKAIANPL